MDHSKLLVKCSGHSLELHNHNGRPGEAYFCWTCDTEDCKKIAWFNEHYRVRIDPKSPKGWHVVEAK